MSVYSAGVLALIHSSRTIFKTAKESGPKARPGVPISKPIHASKNWTNVIVAAIAATPPRERVTIAMIVASGSAMLREAASNAYSLPLDIPSERNENAALTSPLKNVKPAQAQKARWMTPIGFMTRF